MRGEIFLKKGIFSEAIKKADLPGEVILDVPYMTLSGDFDFTVENHRGIIAYENSEIKINTKNAILKIEGEKLCISNITDEIISVEGKIRKLEFI